MLSAIPFHRRRDLGDVLNVTFLFLRQNLKPLGKSLLFIVAPVWVLLSVPNALLQVSLLEFDPEAPGTFELGRLGGQYVIVALLAVLASVLQVCVVYGFMRHYQQHGGPGSVGVDDVWRFAQANIWRVLGAGLLAAAIAMIGMVVALVPCLGFLAFLAGVVYLAVVATVAVPALLWEGSGIAEAFVRARALVRGAFWQTLGVLFVSWLLVTILGFLFSLPMVILSFTAGLHGAEAGAGAVGRPVLVAAGMLASLGSMLLYPIPLVAMAFQYFSLVEGKDRTGLMERIEAMEDPRGGAGGGDDGGREAADDDFWRRPGQPQ